MDAEVENDKAESCDQPEVNVVPATPTKQQNRHRPPVSMLKNEV